MGCAFINFVAPASLKSFYTAYNGRKWRKFRSEKICEVTYARLQGIQALEDHFHCSRVLNFKGKNHRPVFKNLGGKDRKQGPSGQTTFPVPK